MKIKNIVSLLICTAVIFVLVSCASTESDAPDGMKILDQASGSYTVYIPNEWVADMSSGFASAYASSTDRSNISFTAYTVPDDALTPDGKYISDAKSYWEYYENKLKDVLSDIKYETYGEETTEDGKSVAVNYSTVKLDGLDANKYTFSAQLDGTDYKFIQIVCVHGTDVYIFCYTATEEAFDSHLDDVDKIVKNVRFN
ncbi:MAG: hypothetical protein PUB34_02030 [Clostridia bacterium]|nr:hypothetical protein [Clostridia bacterium]